MLVVRDLRKAIGHGAKARAIAAGRHLQIERLVWPIEVVDAAPAVKSPLHLVEIAEALEGKHFGLQGAMKALVLAAALRVKGPAMQDVDAELEQPHAQPGPGRAHRIAPRAAIVDEERRGEPIAAECDLELALNRFALLVGTGGKTNRKARVIINNGQRMASRVVGQPHPALEVHLPQQIRRFLLKALIGSGATNRRLNPAMPAQDLMDR